MKRIAIICISICMAFSVLAAQDVKLESEKDRLWLNINSYVVECCKMFWDKSIEYFILKYGIPQNISAEVIENKYYTEKDILYKITYKNMVICTQYIGGSRAYLFQWVTFSSKDIFSLWGISVGSTIDVFYKVFGPELESSPAINLVYNENIVGSITIYNLE